MENKNNRVLSSICVMNKDYSVYSHLGKGLDIGDNYFCVGYTDTKKEKLPKQVRDCVKVALEDDDNENLIFIVVVADYDSEKYYADYEKKKIINKEDGSEINLAYFAIQPNEVAKYVKGFVETDID